MDAGEIERELDELETRIERLRALYEQYFMGLEKLEPLIPRKEVERRIWVLRREQIRNTGLRFKFQMLVQRFNTFQQYWSRVAREIENGTYRRDIIRAARRFGAKEALTILGRKRAQQYAILAAAQEARKRPGEDDAEALDRDEADELLADEDLLEEDDDGEELGDEHLEDVSDEPASLELEEEADETPTPTRHLQRSPASLPPPRMSTPPPPMPTELWGEAGAPESSSLPEPPTAKRQARGGRSKPPDAAKQRLVELAAQVRSTRGKEGEAAPGGGPLELDLDFDGPRTIVPRKTTKPPPRRGSSAKMGTVRPPSTSAPPAKAASGAAPRKATSRSLRAVRTGSSSAIPRAAAPPDPAPPARGVTAEDEGALSPSAPPPPRPEMIPPPGPRHDRAGARSASEAPPRRPETPRVDLEEKRLRQIYVKYIETRRTVNEPTAGITFEKLAESLRAQAAKLRETHPSKSVDYEVVVKNGKTLLRPILRGGRG